MAIPDRWLSNAISSPMISGGRSTLCWSKGSSSAGLYRGGAGSRCGMTGPLLTLLNAQSLATFTASGYWGDETLYAVAARQARATPHAFAVRDRYRRLTYAALVAVADRLAASLAGRGLRP